MGKLRTLATAAMLASTVPAGAQAPENDVQVQISEVLTNEGNVDNKNTLSAEDVKVRLQLEEQLNAYIKGKKLKNLVDFYGENEVKSRIYEMIDEIHKNLDKYGTFDDEGNFILLNDDGSLIYEDQWRYLYKSYFIEFLDGKDDTNKMGYWSIIAFLILAFFSDQCWLYLSNSEIKSLKEKNENLEKENERLKGRHDRY